MALKGGPRATQDDPRFDPRVIAFHNLIVRHPKLDDMLAEIDRWLKNPEPYLLYVLGPTGVGKSTVRKILHRRFLTRAANDPHYPNGWIPVAGYRTLPPSKGRYDHSANYLRGLRSVDEPLSDFKTLRPRPGVTVLVTGTPREDALREALVSAIDQRHVELFWIDEAQHMAQAASAKSAKEHADLFKSLQDDVKIPVVLFGHYTLRNLEDMHGQLVRRSYPLHFARYRIDVPEEAEQFRNVLHTFQGKIPIRCEVNLVRRLEVCYQETLGCVGLLHMWLERALVRAITEDPNGPLTWKHLKADRRPRDERRQILDEILNGEQKFAVGVDATAEDNALMGLDDFRSAQGQGTGAAPKTPIKLSKPARRQRRPGESYPRRRQIGMGSWEDSAKNEAPN